MSTLAQRIREIRGELSQKDFAQLIGINVNSLRHYERGERTPNADVLESICRHTGVSSGWLLLGESWTPAPECKEREEVKRGISIRALPNEKFKARIVTTGYSTLVYLPRVGKELANDGSFVEIELVDKRIAFELNWLAGMGNVEEMAIYELSTSDETHIGMPGNLVVIDTSVKKVAGLNDIYVVNNNGRAYFMSLVRIGKVFYFTSDGYDVVEDIPAKEAVVVGRLILQTTDNRIYYSGMIYD